MQDPNTQLIVSLIGKRARGPDGLQVAAERALRVQLPADTRADLCDRAKADCEILLSRIEQYPDLFSRMLNAVTAGHLDQAAVHARKMALSEADFQREGGGAVWLAVAVAVAILLYCDEAR